MKRSNHRPESPAVASDSVREEAARWVVRRDRGFSAREEAEFGDWLRADPLHAKAIERSFSAWRMLERMSLGIQTVLPERQGRRRRNRALGLAAAAGLVFAAFVGGLAVYRGTASQQALSMEAGAPRSLHLADGSIVQLNVGSELLEQFTLNERRVILIRGEASFTVAKDPARPFIVRAGTVGVRAVGTVFNVNLLSRSVEVTVTEGQVRVASDSLPTSAPVAAPEAESPILGAGQRAIVDFGESTLPTAVIVSEVTAAEIAQALAWQNPLRRLGGSTLAELAAEFQDRTGHRLVLKDSALAEMRIGGRFRLDDLDGFVRVLEQNYGVVAERGSRNETVLRLSESR